MISPKFDFLRAGVKDYYAFNLNLFEFNNLFYADENVIMAVFVNK